MSVDVNCNDGIYTYKFFNLYFIPESGLFRSVGYYQTNPDYLISLYKKKHLGIEAGLDLGRKKIREYLTRTNEAMEACVASLNKAMAN